MKLTSLQVRVTATFLGIIIVLSAVAFSILIHARNTAAIYENGISELVKIADLTQAVDQGARAVGRLASEAELEKAIEAFRPIEERIYRLRESLPGSTQHPDSVWILHDLGNMANSFLIEAGAAVHALRRGDPESYFKHDREAATVAAAVRETADRLLAKELERYSTVYPEVISRNRDLQTTNVLSLLALAIVAFGFAWGFAKSVTAPLQDLATAAERIAGGDLGGPAVALGASSEIQTLGYAFNHMQNSIRRHVTDLQEKAELERRLQAEELENLQVHSLLREVELRALQSQVNPHFLFNTLNMVAKTALIEGAEQTRELMETVADLLRYSLRDLDRPVTLGAELDQVQRYMTIQGQRFGERTRFLMNVTDATVLACPLPCLTLQPLVENALIHGIGKREEGGTVALTVRHEGGRIIAAVSDDGEGIAPERLVLLNQGAPGAGAESPAASASPVPPGPAPAPGGHTTGIGIQNVRRRLELFYHGDASLTVASTPGLGTAVTINLPAKGVDEHAHPGS